MVCVTNLVLVSILTCGNILRSDSTRFTFVAKVTVCREIDFEVKANLYNFKQDTHNFFVTHNRILRFGKEYHYHIENYLKIEDICADTRCRLAFVLSRRKTAEKDWLDFQWKYKSIVITSPDPKYKFKYVATLPPTCGDSHYTRFVEFDNKCSNATADESRKPNHDRPKCTPKVIVCPPDKYGKNCEYECTRCAKPQCEGDGECVEKECKHFESTGIKCDKKCEPGSWGLLMHSSASNKTIEDDYCNFYCFCRFGKSCHGIKGTCPDGLCAAGYKVGCQEKCPPRMWSGDGVTCNNTCQCEHDEDCYHDGECPNGPKLCWSNYGPNCTKKCHCKNGESCNNDTGTCANGCDVHHYTSDCQSKCQQGYYHQVNDPDGVCSGRCHCKNDVSCEASNGRCPNGVCAVDYWGDSCEHECRYGTDCVNGKPCHCLRGNQYCNNETGCDECSHRWTGRQTGENCQTTCKDNFWGPPTCEHQCQCKVPRDCRVFDGECRGPCPPRKYGVRCDQDCTDTTTNVLCSKKRCNCLNEDRDCDVVSNICRGVCNIRYVGGDGNRCEQKCPDGQHLSGSDTCVGNCHCLIDDLCNVTSGACVGQAGCTVGWVEPTCLQMCKYGWNGCHQSCHCLNDAPCNELTGACPNALCELRHFGPDCQGKCENGHKFQKLGLCTGDCHCANTDQCRAQNGECLDQVCHTGWEGVDCQTRCKYGLERDNCEKICHCKGGHPCGRVSGYCARGCDTRYYGTGCNSTCVKTFFLDNNNVCNRECHCLNPAKCDATTGVCVAGGCARGFSGEDCQTKCSAGSFGFNCKGTCHCSATSECDSITGQCSDGCHRRFTGYNCSESCDEGLYRINGKCDGQCHCLEPVMCHIHRGNCEDNVCSPGWMLNSDPITDNQYRKCNKACPSGKWGQDCRKNCHCQNGTRCDHINGHCESGCATRWFYSPTCNKTCGYGMYLGQYGDCTEYCECENAKYCRVEHGVCVRGGCKSGAQSGSRCLLPCEKNRYRTRIDKNCTEYCHCRRDLPCDDIGGSCPSGCHHRYRDPHCNKSCPAGYFGENCSNECHCSNESQCHVGDGACLTGGCKAGYVGHSCQTPCTGKRYGPGCRVSCQCLNGAKCQHITGECPNKKCNKRFEGRNCDKQICPPYKFRTNGKCYGVCHCLKNRDCDAYTGDCGNASCMPGRKGEHCEYLCHNTFGPGCANPCHCFENKQCDTDTGNCPAGCDLRHSGNGCQETCPIGRYDPDSNCDKRCRCAWDHDCAVIDGYCSGGLCRASRNLRFYGDDCQQVCTRGRYLIDSDCIGVCRCAVPELCNLFNGSCNGGQCKNGWRGDKCNIECEDRTFGPACSRKCRCKFNKTCTKDYGKCEDGCEDSWTGENCQIKKDYSSFVEQIGIYSGTCLGIGLVAVLLGYIALAQRNRMKRRFTHRWEDRLQRGSSRSHTENSTQPTVSNTPSMHSKEPSEKTQATIHRNGSLDIDLKDVFSKTDLGIHEATYLDKFTTAINPDQYIVEKGTVQPLVKHGEQRKRSKNDKTRRSFERGQTETRRTPEEIEATKKTDDVSNVNDRGRHTEKPTKEETDQERIETTANTHDDKNMNNEKSYKEFESRGMGTNVSQL